MRKIDIFKNSKVLITGGGGYLGSKLAEKIVHKVSRLYLLDIQFNELSKNLCKKNKNAYSIELNLLKKKELKKFCFDTAPDIIYHFSALLNRERDFCRYQQLYEVNVQGTINILEALRNINYIKFIFSSSSEVYGNKNKSPFNEKQVPEPISPYSLTKLMAEELIRTYSNIYEKPFTILRIFNFYGEDMQGIFFLSQLFSALNNNEFFKMTGGEQIRDFMNINELLYYIIKISQTKKSNNEIINICSGKGIKLKKMAFDTAKNLQKIDLIKIGSLPYRKNEVWVMIGDNTKLKKIVY